VSARPSVDFFQVPPPFFPHGPNFPLFSNVRRPFEGVFGPVSKPVGFCPLFDPGRKLGYGTGHPFLTSLLNLSLPSVFVLIFPGIFFSLPSCRGPPDKRVKPSVLLSLGWLFPSVPGLGQTTSLARLRE